MNRNHLRACVVAALWLSAIAWTSPARAGRLVFQEETEIVGEVQKPEITITISRENLNKAFDLTKLQESFLDRIVKSVEREPF